MLNLINSLSLATGAIVVAALSAFLALFWTRIRYKAWDWILALLTPLIIAVSLYRSPVWLGASSEEFDAWAFAFIVPWYVAGALPSFMIVLLARELRTRREARVINRNR